MWKSKVISAAVESPRSPGAAMFVRPFLDSELRCAASADPGISATSINCTIGEGNKLAIAGGRRSCGPPVPPDERDQDRSPRCSKTATLPPAVNDIGLMIDDSKRQQAATWARS